jgi:hypothetical protein
MNYSVVFAIKFHSLSLVKNDHVMRHDSFVEFGHKIQDGGCKFFH